MAKKLVLFDIDGTLLFHVGERSWGKQYAHGLEIAYGITGTHDFEKYNGSIERDMAWKIAGEYGISREDFLANFPAYVQAMHEHLETWAKKGPVFEVIPDAVSLVKLLSHRQDIVLGILTGNARRIADWKLIHTGLDDFFAFGLFGEEADSRNELARTVFAKAETQLHHVFAPSDIVVIGDTVHDIRCGKSIGAVTIAVTTGMHADPASLDLEHPDFRVHSLIDPVIRTFFSV